MAAVLFFVDESFQTIGGKAVGSLGAVAIPPALYNRFCKTVYRIKQEELGATELEHCEFKGNSFFSRAAFRYDESGKSESALFSAMSRLVGALEDADAHVFALWTVAPELLSLRAPGPPFLTKPYVELIRDFDRVMRNLPDERGFLFFDQLGHKEDRRAACAIQNWMIRSSHHHTLNKRFLQLPHFTHSAVSPGLQAADLVAYLAAQQIDPSVRPELNDWWEAFSQFAVSVSLGGSREHSTTRMLRSTPTRA